MLCSQPLPNGDVDDGADRCIERRRVTRRLRDGAAHRVVLIAAPAGFGKSVALAHFLQNAAPRRVLLRVAPGTSTMLGLLRSLAESSAAVAPGMHQSFAIAYERAMRSHSPEDILAAWFCEHLKGRKILVAVDDLQYAPGDDVTRFLVRAIESGGSRMSWILCDRSAERFPVVAWLAAGFLAMPIDETNLSFTQQEIRELACAAGRTLGHAAISRLATTTAGRATALRLALCSAEAAAARFDGAMRCEELASSILYGLRDPGFFLRASVLGDLDVPMLRAAGWETPEQDIRVLQQAGCVERLSEGLYRYDSGFRDLLTRELQGQGEAAVTDATLAAAETFERVERYAEALSNYAAAQDREAALRLLKRHGMKLIDSGSADIVQACMSRLVDEDEGHAALIGIKAALASQVGHHDLAEAWFKQAIELARDPESKAALVYRSSLDLLRQRRSDCIATLEQCVGESGTLQPALHATLATAYVIANRIDDARRSARCARDSLKHATQNLEHARTIHQIGYVALRIGDFAEAKRFANKAVRLALRHGDYDLASRAYSVLYELAHSIECDPPQALRYVEMVANCAAKTGDVHVQVWALMAALYVETERGDAQAMRAFEEALSAIDVVHLESDATLLPAQALRRAWSGDFEQAHRLIAESAEAQFSADRRALRFAAVALYAAAAGSIEDARAAIESADWALLDASLNTKQAMQAEAYLVLAAALATGVESAASRLEHFAQACFDVPPPIEALMSSVRAIYENWSGAANHGEVLASFATMRERHLGGVSMLFEALPVPS